MKSTNPNIAQQLQASNRNVNWMFRVKGNVSLQVQDRRKRRLLWRSCATLAWKYHTNAKGQKKRIKLCVFSEIVGCPQNNPRDHRLARDYGFGNYCNKLFMNFWLHSLNNMSPLTNINVYRSLPKGSFCLIYFADLRLQAKATLYQITS